MTSEEDFNGLRAKAERGDADAQWRVGFELIADNGINKDPSASFEWFTKSAKQGNANGQMYLGWLYRSGLIPKSDAEAFKWYRSAAEKGQVYAQYFLALLHWGNPTDPFYDLVEAYAWLAVVKARQSENKDVIFQLERMQHSMTKEQIEKALSLARDRLEISLKTGEPQ